MYRDGPGSDGVDAVVVLTILTRKGDLVVAVVRLAGDVVGAHSGSTFLHGQGDAKAIVVYDGTLRHRPVIVLVGCHSGCLAIVGLGLVPDSDGDLLGGDLALFRYLDLPIVRDGIAAIGVVGQVRAILTGQGVGYGDGALARVGLVIAGGPGGGGDGLAVDGAVHRAGDGAVHVGVAVIDLLAGQRGRNSERHRGDFDVHRLRAHHGFMAGRGNLPPVFAGLGDVHKLDGPPRIVAGLGGRRVGSILLDKLHSLHCAVYIAVEFPPARHVVGLAGVCAGVVLSLDRHVGGVGDAKGSLRREVQLVVVIVPGRVVRQCGGDGVVAHGGVVRAGSRVNRRVGVGHVVRIQGVIAHKADIFALIFGSLYSHIHRLAGVGLGDDAFAVNAHEFQGYGALGDGYGDVATSLSSDSDHFVVVGVVAT